MQLPIALYIMWSPAFSANRLYSNTALSHALTTISSGYFLYDVRARPLPPCAEHAAQAAPSQSPIVPVAAQAVLLIMNLARA